MSAVRAHPLVAATMIIAIGCVAIAPTPRAAEATVRPHLGFRATVAGHSSWYGSYDMGALGPAWCIDHGIASPDPGLDYQPTQPAVSPATRTAVAWLVGRHGYTTDPTTAAAMMLALHDLMGATYPAGRLDVDRLASEHLAGFAGSGTAVVERARALKNEAIAHNTLVAPFAITLDAENAERSGRGLLRVRITDADGRPVPNANLLVNGTGAHLDTTVAETDREGEARLGYRMSGAAATFTAHAAVADLELAAFAPTRRRAQRVVVPRQLLVEAHLDVVVEAPPEAPGRVTVHKTGDATDVAPITGAVFELTSIATGDPVSELVIGPEGTAGPVEVEPGSYELVETGPPPGYLAAADQRVEVGSGEHVIIEVHDIAAPGSLTITKVDVDDPSGRSLTGAVLDVFTHHPGHPEARLVKTIETTEQPHTVAELRHGTYWIVERTPPAGFDLDAEPRAVEVRPGEDTSLQMANHPSLPDVVAPEPVAPPTPTTSTTTTTAPRPRPHRPRPDERIRRHAPLPRTGATTVSTSLLGAGIVLLGLALTIGADVGPDGRFRPRRRWRPPTRHRHRPDRARSSAGGPRTRRSRHRPSRDRR